MQFNEVQMQMAVKIITILDFAAFAFDITYVSLYISYVKNDVEMVGIIYEYNGFYSWR